VAIVGDIKHSRVARSATEALTKLGVGELRLVGPQELLPENAIQGTQIYSELDSGIEGADVVMSLRIQKERFAQLGEIPDPQEYFRRFGLTEERMRVAKPDAIVMHPGPMNRGVEIDGSLADSRRSVIQEQVTNGLAIRMAVLALVYEHIQTTRGKQS
jgi:aspartate carbamoyltransferase catalytic subunit